jgi:hypothetical protein
MSLTIQLNPARWPSILNWAETLLATFDANGRVCQAEESMEMLTQRVGSSASIGSPRATGLAVLRAYLNLREVRPGPAHAALDATWRAGRTADLALRMRRHSRLPYRAIEAFGQLISLSPSELSLWALPTLRNLQVIDYTVGADAAIGEVEERVGVAAPVLTQVTQIWNHLAPPPIEACAIASADHATFCPLTESDHRGALEVQGFPAEVHERAFAALTAIGLLRRERSQALGEDVFWAPYVWSTEAIDIAEFMKRLPSNEREALATLSRRAAEHPGQSIDELGADQRVVAAARHAGLVDATRVVSGQTERGFAFSPGIEHRIGEGLTDATHERKLFVAHILNGHRYGHPYTGKIDYPVALVRALINKGAVGPTTAARRDYGLLEAAGIVRAEEVGGGKAMLHLVKSDVAEDSLGLLKLALDDDPTKSADSVEALWIPGSHEAARTPEGDRHRLPAPEGDQRELVQSSIEQLRLEITRNIRGEELRG